MKTVTLRNKTRALWRLFLFCFVFLLGALAVTIVDAATPTSAPIERDFWVANHAGKALSFRRAHATLRASGESSMVYVEDRLFGHGVSGDFVNRLEWQLETAAPSSAFMVGDGILPYELQLFGPLPSHGPGRDDRLIILFADLSLGAGTSDAEGGAGNLDALFHFYDQLSDAEALKRYGQHSNDANVIYVNGFRRTEAYTTSVITHELEHLLTSRGPLREGWLTESLSEGGMLLTGLYGDQERVSRYAANPGHYPLVSTGTVQLGPQLLFASFLLDSLPLANGTPIGALAASPKLGRDAVEELWLRRTDAPLSFDAIFSNFVSYVLTQSEGAAYLPSAWRHSPGIQVPRIDSYYTYRKGSEGLSGFLAPYSFVAIDLESPLSPTSVIELEHLPPPADVSAASCSRTASVLWKPVHATRIAIYAVGCDPGDKTEFVQFRLRIVDQPSLLHR